MRYRAQTGCVKGRQLKLRLAQTGKSPLLEKAYPIMQRREASLGMIQNVHFEVPHVIAGLLGYGNVVVQTAGAGEFTFTGVPNPGAVKTVRALAPLARPPVDCNSWVTTCW